VVSRAKKSQQLNSELQSLAGLKADVAAALVWQDFPKKSARSAAESAEGDDFEPLFRSALASLTGSKTAPAQGHKPLAVSGNPVPKADTVSASKPTAQGIDLTSRERKLMRRFVERGRAIDKTVRQFLDLAVKVREIFGSKTRGVPVIFEGKSYLTFDDFVERNFPICGRTMRRWLAAEGKTDQRFNGNANDGKHYWLTPPELLAPVKAEFGDDLYDPCPFPAPDGFDGLAADWGKVSYVNPPFGSVLSPRGKKIGITAWVRKAIKEQAKGKTVVMVYPMNGWVHMLLKAGAKFRSIGKVNWLATEDGASVKSNSRPIMMFVLPARGGADARKVIRRNRSPQPRVRAHRNQEGLASGE
jgi:hypothetical protein